MDPVHLEAVGDTLKRFCSFSGGGDDTSARARGSTKMLSSEHSGEDEKLCNPFWELIFDNLSGKWLQIITINSE